MRDLSNITIGSLVSLTENEVLRHNNAYPELPISSDNVYRVVSDRDYWSDLVTSQLTLALVSGTDEGIIHEDADSGHRYVDIRDLTPRSAAYDSVEDALNATKGRLFTMDVDYYTVKATLCAKVSRRVLRSVRVVDVNKTMPKVTDGARQDGKWHFYDSEILRIVQGGVVLYQKG